VRTYSILLSPNCRHEAWHRGLDRTYGVCDNCGAVWREPNISYAHERARALAGALGTSPT